MKYKKVRGHKRLQKQIEQWRLENTSIHLTDYLLNTRDRYYVKIRIYPWNGFVSHKVNSIVAEPTGKTRQLFLNALLDIYSDWKSELEKLGQPYYLKIWLYEPRFSKSQVVCAIGENLDFYQNTFTVAGEDKVLNLDNYGAAKIKMENLNWEHHLDEEHFENNFIGEPDEYTSVKEYLESQVWFRKLLKKPHIITPFEEPVNGAFEYYSFTEGNVWIGG